MSRSTLKPRNGVHPAVRAIYDNCGDRNMSDVLERAGLHKNQWRWWALGKTSPTLQNIEAVLNVLGLTVAAVPLRS